MKKILIYILLFITIFNFSACAKAENHTPTPTPITAIITPVVTPTEETLDYINNDLARQTFILINKQRDIEKRHFLLYNMKLQEAAELRAQEIATSFSHTRPDGSTCFTAVKDFYLSLGENIICANDGLVSAENFVYSWMNSKSHRENILSPDYDVTAIGVYEQDGITYMVELFAK